MKTLKTSRGFSLMNFQDSNGTHCSVQESSRVGSFLWLGADEVEVQVMTEQGWGKVDFASMSKDNQFVGNQRMHLSQDNVKALLPVLEYFAEHGCLPEITAD